MTNNRYANIQLAVDSMPWAIDPNQPFPDDYADFTPLGQCPEHGLEPLLPGGREVGTGYDICIAAVFACGALDLDSIF